MTATPADVRVQPVARYTYQLFSSRTQEDVVINLYDARAPTWSATRTS